MTAKPRAPAGGNGAGPSHVPAGRPPSDELDMIAVADGNFPQVAAWLTARGYAVRRPKPGEQALSAFHSAHLDWHAVGPGDILICDQATGRVWKG